MNRCYCPLENYQNPLIINWAIGIIYRYLLFEIIMISSVLIDHIKNIFDFSLDGVFVKDRKFRYHYINSTVCHNTGYSAEEFNELCDTDMFPEYSDNYNNHDQLAINGCVFNQIDGLTNKAGKDLFVFSQKSPLRDKDGLVYGVLGVCKYIDMYQLPLVINNYSRNLKININLPDLFERYTGLSKRENEVLLLLLKGLSTKAIAYNLKISQKTVTFHINNIKEKWQCYSKESIFKIALLKNINQFLNCEMFLKSA